MDTGKKIAVFLGEFDLQMERIADIYSLLGKKLSVFDQQNVSSETVESAGYWLHNLYCAFEDLFKQVAGFWENCVLTNGGFHINLLKRMLAKIEGIRPALLSVESYRCLNELRGFRHVFRYAYSYGLDDERVFFLLRRILSRKESLIRDLEIFRRAIAPEVKDERGKSLISSSFLLL